MLNRKDIIKIVKNLNIPKDSYWITSGAGLVIHGVKESTGDIDLGADTSLVNYFIEKGCKCKSANDGTRIVEVNEEIEILENWFVDEVTMIEGLPVATLESIKKQKLELGREKDLRDIKLIEEFTEY